MDRVFTFFVGSVEMIKLGVNVDHVATIREARKTVEPDPVWAAALCELAGARCVTVHLREDRRHIQERDVRILRQTVRTKLNLEMANSEEIVDIAIDIKPDQCTLVPEKRQEVTTEGGLDVVGNLDTITGTTQRLRDAGIAVSLFIDPEEDQVRASAEAGAEFIEFHTGRYANARDERSQVKELEVLENGAETALKLGLRVNAGHGLDYVNIHGMHNVPGLEEVNIGHSIVSRAIFVGLDRAVREMVALLQGPGGAAKL
jgi:pyridoxine 5-phosphate synthase